MKILLTGSMGFIGTRLKEVLVMNHVEFVEYDLINGDDIRDTFKLDKLFEIENFDMVVHLAALAGVRRGEEFPNEYISTNIMGTQNLINMCEKYGVDKFIFYSSSSVLGGGEKLNEKSPYNPKSLYGITKMAGEYIVENSKVQSVIVRPFTVYGENGRKDMVVYKWIYQIKSGRNVTFYGNGDTERGYTYIEDLVNATVRIILDFSHINHKHSLKLNIGGSEVIKLSHLLGLFEKHCENKNINHETEMMELPKADVVSSYANTNLAKKLLKFNPKKRFDKVINNILKNELK